ncbi:hypothetical protein ACIQUF_18550 [Pseudomonas sp. NPDC090233]|uniref:hypothetical protein n=1 Tax=Pseudomonas sp. NPDC090233 TaxID=3364479 RepID=UPI00383BF3F9
MPPSLSTAASSFKQQVNAHFANRPTLRQVLAQEGLRTLTQRYPTIATHNPGLTSLEGFSIMEGVDEDGLVKTRSLVDVLLEHFLSGQPLALEASVQFSLAPPATFRAQEQGIDPAATPEINLDPVRLNADFDDMLMLLVESYQRAQVSFWNACREGSSISRLRWLQQTIRSAVLISLADVRLDNDEKAAVYAMLDGNDPSLSIYGLHVTLASDAGAHSLILPDILLAAERDERRLLLWCKPSGELRGYESTQAFAAALRDQLAANFQFDTLSWSRTVLKIDAFAYQAVQLLKTLLDTIGRARLANLDSLDQLPPLFDQLSDPAAHFDDLPYLTLPTNRITLPAWLASSGADDRFSYQQALLAASARQALSEGRSSLDDIEDIHRYAARRLREQMRADQPGATPYDPDQLTVWIAGPDPLPDPALPATLKPRRALTLTELAVSRVHLQELEVLSHITGPGAQRIDGWMNVRYASALIETLDIGGQYPSYVDARLNDASERPMRLQRFAHKWRACLLFDALKAKIDGHLCEQSTQAIIRFCLGTAPESEQLDFAPLAFRCAPGVTALDQVRGMFLIKVRPSASWIVYRPLFNHRPIFEFASLAALAGKIREGGELQQSILGWLDDDARPIYDDGGFTHPHLHPRLSQLVRLLPTTASLLDSALQKLVQPVAVVFDAWQTDLDLAMYQARNKATLILASRAGVSSAQQRWQTVKQFAWLLLNFTAPILPPPLAGVAWLAISVIALKEDIPQLLHGDDAQKSLALADVLANLAMLLVHEDTQAAANTHVTLADLDGPSPLNHSAPAMGAKAVEQPASSEKAVGSISLTRWHDDQRLGNLPKAARNALGALQANVSLEGVLPEPSGRARGLYKIAERYYVNLQGTAYEVCEEWQGFQIIGPDQAQGPWASQWGGQWDGYYVVGREPARGPWVTRWGGQWVIDLYMAGGMRSNRETVLAKNRARFDELVQLQKDNEAQLTKFDSLIRHNATVVHDYDIEAVAWRKEYVRFKETGVADMPADMQARDVALRAKLEAVRPNILVLALIHEKVAGLLQSNVDLYNELSEPRFSKMARQDKAKKARDIWIEELLTNDMSLYGRLLQVFDHTSLRQLVEQVRTATGPAQLNYRAELRARIQEALKVHQRLLNVSERLDESLPKALNDPQVGFTDKASKLNDFIEERPYSTLIVRGQIVNDLIELSLNRGLLADGNREELLLMQRCLRNRDYEKALLSHNDIVSANLTPEETVELLSDIVRQYERVRTTADYLLMLSEPALDTAMLNELVAQTSILKCLAETQLSAALKASEPDAASTSAPPLPRPVYRVRSGKRQLVRTSKGRVILAEEGANEGQAVQHDPITQATVSTYQQQGEQWVEVLQTTQPATAETAQLKKRAEDLLQREAEIIRTVSRYKDEPNSLADLMDWRIQDMQDIARQLSEHKEATQGLAARLQTTIQRLQSEKRRLLIDAYLDTQHPDSTALRYLHEQGEVSFAAPVLGKRLRANDYLDIYPVHRTQAPGGLLWEVHFHYPTANSAPQAFSKGHLKMPTAQGIASPRALERQVQLQRAHTAHEQIEVYRANLRLKEVEGLIPFPPSRSS